MNWKHESVKWGNKILYYVIICASAYQHRAFWHYDDKIINRKKITNLLSSSVETIQLRDEGPGYEYCISFADHALPVGSLCSCLEAEDSCLIEAFGLSRSSWKWQYYSTKAYILEKRQDDFTMINWWYDNDAIRKKFKAILLFSLICKNIDIYLRWFIWSSV